ncbi:MAG: hypothetical protein ACI959_002108, partial [Limisphaerales bacterium]
MMTRLFFATFFLTLCAASSQLIAQVPGDTIIVRAFNYESGTRDTIINFPTDPSLTYEKILLHYNMRCKDGLISPAISGQTNLGCGEWDYSCNTYITDSTKVDSINAFHPTHIISNYSGGSPYSYVINPLYDYYRYVQPVVSSTVITETQSTVGAALTPDEEVLATDNFSGKSQYLFTASELLGAGLSAGDIDGLLLESSDVADANFLRVRLKTTTLTALTAIIPDTTGYTETYFQNTSFATGSNRLQFNSPFNWDGISNVLLEFSFTNSTPGSTLNLLTANTAAISGLYANENAYINTASDGKVDISASNTTSIVDAITISYWSKGNSGASSTNTTAIEGLDGDNLRQVNVHHPWSNSRIYWDCGNDGSGYDRIDKLATSSEVENQWHHWAFTKNTSSGIMRIYKDGTLWHSGTGKTRPITIDSLVFGSSARNTYTYPGSLDEL